MPRLKFQGLRNESETILGPTHLEIGDDTTQRLPQKVHEVSRFFNESGLVYFF